MSSNITIRLPADTTESDMISIARIATYNKWNATLSVDADLFNRSLSEFRELAPSPEPSSTSPLSATNVKTERTNNMKEVNIVNACGETIARGEISGNRIISAVPVMRPDALTAEYTKDAPQLEYVTIAEQLSRYGLTAWRVTVPIPNE